MSKELADKFDRDMSATEGVAERARQARKRGAALDVDWETAFEVYCIQANQDPKKLVRLPDNEPEFLGATMAGRDEEAVHSDDGDRDNSVKSSQP